MSKAFHTVGPMQDKPLTQYEKDAILRALQKALDANAVPPEDRAMVVRGKNKLENLDIKQVFKTSRPGRQ